MTIEASRWGISATNFKLPVLAEAATQPIERRRGHLSFLTWPFYLAQALVAEQFLGDAVRPALAAEEPGRAARSENSRPEFESSVLEPRHRSSDADTPQSPAGLANRANPSDDKLQLAKIAEPPEAREGGVDNGNATEAGASGNGGGSAGGGSKPALSADAGAGTDGVEVGEGNGSLPVTFNSSSIVLLIDASSGESITVTSPLESAVAALGLVTPIVQLAGSLLPVATDATTSLAADLAGMIARIVHAPPALTSTAGAVADLTGDALSVITPITNAAGTAISAAIDGVGELAGDLPDIVAPMVQAAPQAIATPVSHAIEELASPVLAVADQIATVTADAIQLGHGLADGGMIAFAAAPPSALAAELLFGDGGYSLFGIAMSNGAPSPVDLSTDDTRSEPRGLLDHDNDQDGRSSDRGGDDNSRDSLAAAATPILAPATTALDDIGLRLHDGLLT